MSKMNSKVKAYTLGLMDQPTAANLLRTGTTINVYIHVIVLCTCIRLTLKPSATCINT